MTKDDIIIVCGDFGLWHNRPEEDKWLDWLNDRNFTLVFVVGNHECFARLYSDEFEIVDFCGGKAHRIRETVYHLMRGHVFTFEGKRFFAFGGAKSYDIADGILDRDDFDSVEAFEETLQEWRRQQKIYRINHVNWWKEELPTQEELDFGMQTLLKHDFKVDFVITHCLPQMVASVLLCGGSSDILTMYFNGLLNNGLKFDFWFCGHYHMDCKIMGKFQVLYEQIVRIL